MGLFSKTSTVAPDEALTVPDKVIRRAQKIPAGTEQQWIDQTLFLIGTNVTHHKTPSDPLLDEAIVAAQATLALLVQMKNREWG
jgi:hypothetical protein